MFRIVASEAIELHDGDGDAHVVRVVRDSFHRESYPIEGQGKWTVKFEVRLIDPDAFELG